MTEGTSAPIDTAAAELALGVLEGEERAEALRRVLAEHAFATEVAQWHDHFAALFASAPEVEPSEAVLARVERSLDRRPATARWIWPVIAGLSSMAAAVLLVLLVARLPQVSAPAQTRPTPMLAAAIAPTGAGAPVPAVWEATTGTLRLGSASWADRSHSAELWVIGDDAVPHSLGVLRPGVRSALKVASANRARLTPAAVLAVTIEPPGGSPSGKPSGPIVAKGTLDRT